MGTYRISALEEYCHDQAGIVPDVSPRWLFIHFLDELTEGLLAHRVLEGHLTDLDGILEHWFWVFGLMKNAEDGEIYAYYRTFSRDEDPVSSHGQIYLRRTIEAMQGHPSDPGRAGEIIHLFGRQTIAALSVGSDSDNAPVITLYWHPFFTADIALGLLQETVRVDAGR